MKFSPSSIIGKIPSEEEFLSLVTNSDLFVYFGHGGGECYVKGSSIKKASLSCQAYLIGCSSGRPVYPACSFVDVTSTALNYIVAGCPVVAATLWDVTDKDIDRVMKAAFDDYFSVSDMVKKSLAESIWHSRNECLLKWATGSSLVFYGVPS